MHISRGAPLQFTNRFAVPDFKRFDQSTTTLPALTGEFEFKPIMARPSTRQTPVRYRARMPICYLSENQIIV